MFLFFSDIQYKARGPDTKTNRREVYMEGMRDFLVSSQYPCQFLNNQSDQSSIFKRDGQQSVAFIPVVTTGQDLFFNLLMLT